MKGSVATAAMVLARHGAAALIGLQLALPASLSRAEPVDLELVLAVDVSPSIDDFEAAQQRNGYLEALTHPAVISAIRGGALGRIAVSYVEWAGEHYQETVVDWTLIYDAVSARAFAAKLAAQPFKHATATSISGAIDYARRQIEENGYQGRRRVIDVSGDGPNSAGRPVQQARNEAVASGIIINGLPVFNARPNPGGTGIAVYLDNYYERNVIGGPGAFFMIADLDAFAPAILRKLIREIAGLSTPRRAAAEPSASRLAGLAP